MRYIIRLKNNWQIQREKLKKQFSTLTDEDLSVEESKSEELLDKLQQKLGKTKQELITLLNKL